MSFAPSLPFSTAQKLKNPTTQRGRGVHNEIRSVLAVLRHNFNFTREQLWEVLNAKDGYARNPSVPHSELVRLVDWVMGAPASDSPSPASRVLAFALRRDLPIPRELKATDEQIERWQENALAYVGMTLEEVTARRFELKEELKALSPTPLPPSGAEQFLVWAETLFRPEEFVSIVTAHNCGSPIANDLPRTPAMWRTATLPSPSSAQAGVWVRVNPTSEVGSGKGGAVKDADINEGRYVLLENDHLPLPLHFALLLELMRSGQIDVASVTDSGGKSIHALLRLPSLCFDKITYQPAGENVLMPLHHNFGYDLGNATLSRMTRAPGFSRKIKSRHPSGTTQDLYYLNPASSPLDNSKETQL